VTQNQDLHRLAVVRSATQNEQLHEPPEHPVNDGSGHPPIVPATTRTTSHRVLGTHRRGIARSGERSIVNAMVQYQTTVDRAFAALADPTRRAVLERLGRGTATISELAEPFDMTLTGLKKHVLVLEEAGLVLTEKIGRARVCTLAPYAFEGISTWLQRLDRFAQVVERTKGDR
jgi:DNA-binding transcriptional ArsR family regulator